MPKQYRVCKIEYANPNDTRYFIQYKWLFFWLRWEELFDGTHYFKSPEDARQAFKNAYTPPQITIVSTHTEENTTC